MSGYSRKHQGYKDSAPQNKGQKVVQIPAGVHLKAHAEWQKPISNDIYKFYRMFSTESATPSPACNKFILSIKLLRYSSNFFSLCWYSKILNTLTG